MIHTEILIHSFQDFSFWSIHVKLVYMNLHLDHIQSRLFFSLAELDLFYRLKDSRLVLMDLFNSHRTSWQKMAKVTVNQRFCQLYETDSQNDPQNCPRNFKSYFNPEENFRKNTLLWLEINLRLRFFKNLESKISNKISLTSRCIQNDRGNGFDSLLPYWTVWDRNFMICDC